MDEKCKEGEWMRSARRVSGVANVPFPNNSLLVLAS